MKNKHNKIIIAKSLLGDRELTEEEMKIVTDNSPVLFLAFNKKPNGFDDNIQRYLMQYHGYYFDIAKAIIRPQTYRGRRFNCLCLDFINVKDIKQNDELSFYENLDSCLHDVIMTTCNSVAEISIIGFYIPKQEHPHILGDSNETILSYDTFLALIMEDVIAR